MNLGQASLGSTPSINLGGYIPAPVERRSILQQALLSFLANAGGALADRAIGAGAQKLGALTPQEANAATQTAEAARHNKAGEELGTKAEERMGRTTDADIANLTFNQGLGRQEFGLKGELGRGELAQRGKALEETARHNKVEESAMPATVRHLEAQARVGEAQAGMQENVMHTMAVQQLVQGLKPEDPQYKMLINASRRVPVSAYKNIDEWSAAVQKQVQADAAARLQGGGASQAATPTKSVSSMIAEKGLLPTLISSPTQESWTGKSLPGIIEEAMQPGPSSLSVDVDALKRFLVGGPSKFDEPAKLNRYAPNNKVPVIQVSE